MELRKFETFRYLNINPLDESWGVCVTTVGAQLIDPSTNYPPSVHPPTYSFKPTSGRTLDEYQLVYITKGQGYFSSESLPKQKIKAGSIFILFPGEWHNYSPCQDTGWEEYWVGFRGEQIDRLVGSGFFSKSQPLFDIGINSSILDMYNNISLHIQGEQIGYQQIISSIVLCALGELYSLTKRPSSANNEIINKIDEARRMMKSCATEPLSPEQIAHQLGMGYSWFRRMFLRHTGTTPAQYQIQQKIILAKELLTTSDLNVCEIAYRLNFENGSQFASFFKRIEGVTPTAFRLDKR
ncbi:MAG: AraC family transcriptional regulator [Rikenellaceae bacterium]